MSTTSRRDSAALAEASPTHQTATTDESSDTQTPIQPDRTAGPLWRRLAQDPTYRTVLNAGSQRQLSAVQTDKTPIARLSLHELQQRGKQAERQTRFQPEDYNTKCWLVGLRQPYGNPLGSSDGLSSTQSRQSVLPGVSLPKPEVARLIDAEDAVLHAMRSRRNAYFWPWILAAGLRPAELSCLDGAEVPPTMHASLREAFSRLSTMQLKLPSGSASSSPGAPVSEGGATVLPYHTFVAFFAAAADALYPGSHAACAALWLDEWHLSVVTGPALINAAWSRKERGPDGTLIRRFRKNGDRRRRGSSSEEGPMSGGQQGDPPGRASDGADAADEQGISADAPFVRYSLFASLVRCLIEPWLHRPPPPSATTGKDRDGAMAPTFVGAEAGALVDRFLLPMVMDEQRLRKALAAATREDRPASQHHTKRDGSNVSAGSPAPPSADPQRLPPPAVPTSDTTPVKPAANPLRETPSPSTNGPSGRRGSVSAAAAIAAITSPDRSTSVAFNASTVAAAGASIAAIPRSGGGRAASPIVPHGGGAVSPEAPQLLPTLFDRSGSATIPGHPNGADTAGAGASIALPGLSSPMNAASTPSKATTVNPTPGRTGTPVGHGFMSTTIAATEANHHSAPRAGHRLPRLSSGADQ